MSEGNRGTRYTHLLRKRKDDNGSALFYGIFIMMYAASGKHAGDVSLKQLSEVDRSMYIEVHRSTSKIAREFIRHRDRFTRQ